METTPNDTYAVLLMLSPNNNVQTYTDFKGYGTLEQSLSIRGLRDARAGTLT